MFKIPKSSYEEFRRVDAQYMQDLQERGKEDGRRLGQRFYDYFRLDRLSNVDDCILADKLYYANCNIDHLIRQVIDEGN